MEVHFGDRLDVALRGMEMTQRDLAKALSVAESTVSQWVNGKRLPDIPTAIRIAELLRVSTDLLLGSETHDEQFGARLRKVMADRGITLSDVARFTTLNPVAIAQMMAGKRPDKAMVERLASALNLSAEYLLGHDLHRSESKGVEAIDHDRLVVIFRGRPQKLSKEYERLIIKMVEAEEEAEANKKDQP